MYIFNAYIGVKYTYDKTKNHIIAEPTRRTALLRNKDVIQLSGPIDRLEFDRRVGHHINHLNRQFKALRSTNAITGRAGQEFKVI